MKNFKIHKSLLYVISLIIPQLLLLYIFWNALESEISDEWTNLMITWGSLLFGSSALILLDIKEKIPNWILPTFILSGYFIGIFFFIYLDPSSDIPTITRSRTDFTIIPVYLTIPGIFHALLDIIYRRFKPTGTFRSNAINLAVSIATPVICYLFVVVGFPALNSWMRDSFSYELREFIDIVLFSIAAAVFLFFFLRFILGFLVSRKSSTITPVTTLLFALVFPIIGLVLNNSFKAFGNFDFIGLYILVILNAVGLFIISFWSQVQSKNLHIQLVGFLLCCIGLPYVIYFFMVFAPFTPIAFLAILAYGAGILMLTPLVLLVIQLKTLYQTFLSLTKKYSPRKLILSGTLCLAVAPCMVFYMCFDHKTTLENIIETAHHYDTDNLEYKDYDIDKIEYILHQMELNNFRGQSFFLDANRSTPIISIFYNSYVFNNLTLSRQKRLNLEKLFLGSRFNNLRWNVVRPETLEEKMEYSYKTNYIVEGDYYATQIDLEIENLSDKNMQEFVSHFELPEDVFITDYYLDIEDRREYGILAEKSAANWIYDQVTTRRRDPGILQYLSRNTLSLRVFPFKPNEVRTTGFTIYHRNNVSFKMNDLQINIPVEPIPQVIESIGKKAFYIPSEAKQNLPKKQVPIHYYFLVDNTTLGDSVRTKFEHDYKNFSLNESIPNDILYVDADISWNDKPRTKSSGFNLIKATGQISRLHKNQNEIPIVIIYANNKNRYYGDETNLSISESFPFNNLIESNEWDKTIISRMELFEFSNNGNTCFLKTNEAPELISFSAIDDIIFEDNSNAKYHRALKLRLFENLAASNPSNKRTYWLKGLRESFLQNTLSHSTSYISLETEEQKQRMLKKQEEIINNKYIDKPETDEIRMSEPYFWILLILLLSMIFKSRLKTTNS